MRLILVAALVVGCGGQSEQAPPPEPTQTVEGLPVQFHVSSYGSAVIRTTRSDTDQPTCELDVWLPSGNKSHAAGIKTPKITKEGPEIQYAWTYGTSVSTIRGEGRHDVLCKWAERRGRETAAFVVR